MKMEVTYIHPDRLRPYEGNARTHTPEQVAQIAASISEFGFTNPIICDGANTVIAGHGRLLAAEQIGLDAVPVIRLTHLSERQRRALTLADNRIALSSGWDFERLSAEIEALAESDFDLALTGFDEQELDALLKTDAGILPESWAGGVEVGQPKQEINYSEKNKEINIDSFDNICVLSLKFPQKKYMEIKERLHKIADTPEEALCRLLNI